MSRGRVEGILRRSIDEWGSIHLSLLDPVTTSLEGITGVAQQIETAGSSGVMVGGSTVADTSLLDLFVRRVKEGSSLPVILFPNNVMGLSKEADAVWFMSLLNSRSRYYMTGAQMLGAPIVQKLGLEALPMAYLILGQGGAAGFIGDANVIPFDQPSIVKGYALAGSLLGMRFVYLEAGSGAGEPVPAQVISAVKEAVPEALLVVGGGIKEPKDAHRASKAGGDIIVTGTVMEQSGFGVERLSEIVASVRQGGKERTVS